MIYRQLHLLLDSSPYEGKVSRGTLAEASLIVDINIRKSKFLVRTKLLVMVVMGYSIV